MSFNITADMLQKIAGAQGKREVLDGLAKVLPDVMDEYNIDNHLRAAHFLSQLAHESDHFRTLEEYASGSQYEGRRDLGNVKRGDGRRYKGRGPIQLTGRFNYRKYGNKLGVDLENNPELAERPDIGAKTAALFWVENGLNELADRDNVKHVTRRINGGYNGLEDRIAKLKRAKRVLAGVDFEDDLPSRVVVREEVQPVVKPVPLMETPAPVVETKPVETKTVTDVVDGRIVTKTEPLPLFVQMDTENNG